MFTNGWCDIGYNHLMSRDGRVWRGRGGKYIGAHVANHNTGNIGISFMGTHTSTAPTETQMCQAAKYLRVMRQLWPAIDMNRTDVKGHRQYGGTTCPGDALYNRIDLILRKARGGCGAT
jgi:N-acetylmuramoyl-L-alanine amidase-like protein